MTHLFFIHTFLKECLSSDPVVMNHSSNGKHSKTSILDFLECHLILFCLRLSNRKTHGIKSKVSRNTVWRREHVLHGNISLVGPELKNSHPDNNLKHGRKTYSLRGEVGIVHVSISRNGNVLLNDESKSCKHGSTAVLDFGFTEPLHVKVVGESKRIESYVTNVSCSVGGCLDKRDSLGHFSVESRRDSLLVRDWCKGGGRSCHERENGNNGLEHD
mmetsp:Transcript_11334/g.21212  ORF Transcript_11334/g.21212 Transcript_11334/m.21212 type:complete len:216 (+) Transcript_11334:375-1022(+)